MQYLDNSLPAGTALAMSKAVLPSPPHENMVEHLCKKLGARMVLAGAHVSDPIECRRESSIPAGILSDGTAHKDPFRDCVLHLHILQVGSDNMDEETATSTSKSCNTTIPLVVLGESVEVTNESENSVSQRIVSSEVVSTNVPSDASLGRGDGTPPDGEY